jgi:RHS repeat-associated protein
MNGANTNNNRMDGASYDALGNLLINPSDGGHYQYDAESRLIQDVNGAVTTNYKYDAEGRRVAKLSGTTVTNEYLFDTKGNQQIELNGSGTVLHTNLYVGGKLLATYQGTNTYFHFTDWLGTRRYEANSAGTQSEICTNLPFGDSQVCTGTPDATEHHFTGKERDTESNLDYFEARYVSSALGRFLSTDPLGGHVEDPQTTNRYSYARNNPIAITDPTGMDFYLSCTQASATCQKDSAGHLVLGQSGKDGFQPTVVTSASLQDPHSGNSATVNENGVLITSNGQTSQGIFINNTPAADISGSGKLDGFSFHVDSSDEKKGTLSAGEFTFNGNRDQTRETLDKRGAFRSILDRRFLFGKSPDELEYHHNSTQHRFGSGPSPHLSVPDEPKNNVPTHGGFHVDRDAPGVRHLGCATLGVGCQ